MPTPPSRREVRRLRELANRRADIIEGAAELFATKGYDGAQMSEIAAASEMSLTSLYAEFSGKDEIYGAVVEWVANRIRRVVRNRVEEIDDPCEALLALIDSLFECFEENAGLVRLLLAGTHGLPWRMRAGAEDVSRRILDDFHLWLSEICGRAVGTGELAGVDPTTLALVLNGAVLHSTAYVVEHDGASLKDEAPKVREIFRRMLKHVD